MSKIHGLNGLTNLLDTTDNTWSPASANGQSEFSSAVSGATVSASALTQVLYLTEPGDTSAINVGDINQGQIGDCFLLSPIGEIARLKPSFISNMIHVNANGSETVTLYEAGNGHLPDWTTKSFKPVSETVTNIFPNYSVNNGASQDIVANQKEIWPQVIEKAVATLNGGYSAIANGGSPVIAMEELTGHTASYLSPAALTLASLQSLVTAGDLIVMDTLSSGALPSNLVNNHAYMFESISGTGAAATVHFGNPWGFDQPTAMLVSQLSHGFAEVDVGHLS